MILKFYFFIILCHCMYCVIDVCCCHSDDKLGEINLPVDVKEYSLEYSDSAFKVEDTIVSRR